jgi:predicted transcriptional regulator
MPKNTKKELKSSKDEIENSKTIDSDAEDSGDESENEVEVVEPVVDEETKKELTFDTSLEDIINLNKEISEIDSKKSDLIAEHEKSLKELSSSLKKKKSEVNKLLAKLQKLHKNEISVAKKERRKRSGVNNGGFNKETEVPSSLIEFLGLEKGTMLPRPKVFSLLNDKFKELNLKEGQSTVLNKEVAKHFGKKKGYTIEFKDMQTFLAEQYSSEKSTDV